MSDTPLQKLMEYLRQPENSVTSEDPVSRHQEALQGIWEEALRLTDGDVGGALNLARQAVDSQQNTELGETEEEYIQRLDGIPSSAFGDSRPHYGVDKPQHFFSCAHTAHSLSLASMNSGPAAASTQLLGRINELRDEIIGPSGYNEGDVYVNDRGALFGAALADPDIHEIEIRDYLHGPGDTPSNADDTDELGLVNLDHILQLDSSLAPYDFGDNMLQFPIDPLHLYGDTLEPPLQPSPAPHDFGPGTHEDDSDASGNTSLPAYDPGSDADHTSTPSDANYTDEFGHSIHVGDSNVSSSMSSLAAYDPGSDEEHTSAPSEANYTDETGHSAHEGDSDEHDSDTNTYA